MSLDEMIAVLQAAKAGKVAPCGVYLDNPLARLRIYTIGLLVGFCIGIAFGLAWKADPTQPPKAELTSEVYTHDAHGALHAMPALTPP